MTCDVPEEPAIEMINLAAGYIVLGNGAGIARITNMLDCAGDETDDADLCVSAVAEMPNGKWLAVSIGAFEAAELQ